MLKETTEGRRDYNANENKRKLLLRESTEVHTKHNRKRNETKTSQRINQNKGQEKQNPKTTALSFFRVIALMYARPRAGRDARERHAYFPEFTRIAAEARLTMEEMEALELREESSNYT